MMRWTVVCVGVGGGVEVRDEGFFFFFWEGLDRCEMRARDGLTLYRRTAV